jgi:hypothetical protein
MFTKFVIAFSFLALVAAFAGSIPTVAHITLTEPSIIGTNLLQPGEYRILLGDAKITFNIDRQVVSVPAKIETVEKKFDSTEIRTRTEGKKLIVESISLGGSKVRIVFNVDVPKS